MTSLRYGDAVLLGGYNQMGLGGVQLFILGVILAYVTFRDASRHDAGE